MIEIYNVTKNFPESEKYGLISQLNRASVSIPSNIAEGAGRVSNKEFMQFLSISLGSIAEVDTQLVICNRLGYLTDEEYKKLENNLTSIRKMILGLRKYIYEKRK